MQRGRRIVCLAEVWDSESDSTLHYQEESCGGAESREFRAADGQVQSLADHIMADI